MVDGQIRRVSDFSHLLPPSRPKAICPVCMNPVVMKLGSERVHHYAHQSEVVCTASQPETALHLNTKFYIYKQLLSGTKLYLEQRCSNGCGRSRNVSWVEHWEKVKIESEVGPFRPDIAIFSNDEDINAIEIMVTHQVEDDKEAFYKARGIGWLEVNACESIYEGENAWKIDKPLPFAVCKPPLTEWTCEQCREQLRKNEELKIKEQREKEYKQHNYSEIIYSKMVDFYFPSGRKYRELYYLMKVVRNDKPGVFVKTEKNEVFWQQNGEINEALTEFAFDATRREVDRRRKFSEVVDEREWLPWVHGKKYLARDVERYIFRYKWDESVRKWVPFRYWTSTDGT